MDWLDGIKTLEQANHPFIMITVLAVRGSAPREPGTKMLVTRDHIWDTIGGGNLEHEAIAVARDMLNCDSTALRTRSFTLGADLTQCCGGEVDLLFETVGANPFNVTLYGAGHVGQALATILGQLPCRLNWIDSRAEMVGHCQTGFKQAPVHVSRPELSVEEVPKNTWFLVMTHSHEQDFALVEAILTRKDMAFCGLIGSSSKAAKFRNRLRRKQFSKEEVTKLTCPIGDSGIRDKHPMAVAVSVTSQLLKLRQHQQDVLAQGESPSNNLYVLGD